MTKVLQLLELSSPLTIPGPERLFFSAPSSYFDVIINPEDIFIVRGSSPITNEANATSRLINISPTCPSIAIIGPGIFKSLGSRYRCAYRFYCGAGKPKGTYCGIPIVGSRCREVPIRPVVPLSTLPPPSLLSSTLQRDGVAVMAVSSDVATISPSRLLSRIMTLVRWAATTWFDDPTVTPVAIVTL